jgi:hypothetical protein
MLFIRLWVALFKYGTIDEAHIKALYWYGEQNVQRFYALLATVFWSHTCLGGYLAAHVRNMLSKRSPIERAAIVAVLAQFFYFV